MTKRTVKAATTPPMDVVVDEQEPEVIIEDKYMHFDKQPLKLDLGCSGPEWQQKPLDEWIRLDIQPADGIDIVADFGAIPLEDRSVDEIFLGDVIEHVPVWRYDEVLTEWNRILKPGGRIAGRCPNLDRAMRDYAAGKLSLNDAYGSIYGDPRNRYLQHYSGFTMETLTALFAKYGFDVTDYSGSPGPEKTPWWLVFEGIKK